MPPIAVEDVIDEVDLDVEVTRARQNRVAADVLRSLRHGTNHAFLRTARLAPSATSPLLELTLIWCTASCDPSVARRARYVLNLLRRDARA